MQALLTYATDGRDPYTLGIPRLAYTLRRHAPQLPLLVVAPALGRTVAGCANLAHDADFRECPTHGQIPYAFKPYVIRALAARGYRSILWCDVSISIGRDPSPVFALAAERGVLTYENEGHPQAPWTSDDALHAMGCPVEAARGFLQVMSGVVAFDLGHPLGRQVLDEWWRLATDGISFRGAGGSTRPEFRAHRHDQSCLTWLVRKHGIPIEPYGVMRNWNDHRPFPAPPTFVIRGVDKPLRQRWINLQARYRCWRDRRG